jgi:hypothetical protein
MYAGEQVTLRHLPEGVNLQGQVCSVEQSTLIVKIDTAMNLFPLGSPFEITTPNTICLAILERRDGEQMWLQVEHVLDRQVLTRLQSTWKETV